MKTPFIAFNPGTMPKKIAGNYGGLSPRINISKAGLFSLNKGAIALLGIDAKSRISIAQDPDEPLNWYIYLDSDGFPINANKLLKNGTANFSHSLLQRTMLTAIGKDTNSNHTFLLAGQPTTFKGVPFKYWGILIP